MSDLNQMFLDKYKEYENVLREQDISVFDVNEQLTGLKKDRLTIMRQMRNYLTHHADPGFLNVTKEQVSFLDELVIDAKKYVDTVRKAMISARKCCVDVSDTVLTGLSLMAKFNLDYLVVCDNGVYVRLVTLMDLVKTCVKDDKSDCWMSSVKSVGKHVVFVKPDVLVSELQRTFVKSHCCGTCLVTESGNAKSKVLGMFFISA